MEPGSVKLILTNNDPIGLAAQRLSVQGAHGPFLLLRNAAMFSRGRLEARLLRSQRPSIYDVDDGLPWDDGRLSGLASWRKRPWPRSLIARRSASSADRVIAGSDVLASWATDWCSDVVVIPTCVELTDYETKTTYEVSDPPRIGWLGSPATESYVSDIAPALLEVHRQTGARLTLVSGHGHIPPAIACFTDRILWNMDVQRSILGSWDVGIMPLRDGLYERAKCSYKLLQYGAAGLPSVASPVGANSEVLSHYGADAPKSMAEWVDALVASLTAPSSERKASGQRSRMVVEDLYSYETWDQTWRSSVGLAPRDPPRNAASDERKIGNREQKPQSKRP